MCSPASTINFSELPLNLEIILALIVVSIGGTRDTVVGLYNHIHLEDSLHQLRLQIITVFLHLTPPNMIKGLFGIGRFIITNKN